MATAFGAGRVRRRSHGAASSGPFLLWNSGCLSGKAVSMPALMRSCWLSPGSCIPCWKQLCLWSGISAVLAMSSAARIRRCWLISVRTSFRGEATACRHELSECIGLSREAYPSAACRSRVINGCCCCGLLHAEAHALLWCLWTTAFPQHPGRLFKEPHAQFPEFVPLPSRWVEDMSGIRNLA